MCLCFQLRLNKKFCIEHITNAAQPGGSNQWDEIGAWFPLRIPTDERNRGTARECFLCNRYWSVLIHPNVSFRLYLTSCEWPESDPWTNFVYNTRWASMTQNISAPVSWQARDYNIVPVWVGDSNSDSHSSQQGTRCGRRHGSYHWTMFCMRYGLMYQLRIGHIVSDGTNGRQHSDR